MRQGAKGKHLPHTGLLRGSLGDNVRKPVLFGTRRFGPRVWSFGVSCQKVGLGSIRWRKDSCQSDDKHLVQVRNTQANIGLHSPEDKRKRQPASTPGCVFNLRAGNTHVLPTFSMMAAGAIPHPPPRKHGAFETTESDECVAGLSLWPHWNERETPCKLHWIPQKNRESPKLDGFSGASMLICRGVTPEARCKPELYPWSLGGESGTGRTLPRRQV